MAKKYGIKFSTLPETMGTVACLNWVDIGDRKPSIDPYPATKQFSPTGGSSPPGRQIGIGINALGSSETLSTSNRATSTSQYRL